MILLLDNFDSFTYNLLDYLRQLGLHCQVVRNNTPISEINVHQYNAIVFSPGPGIPSNAGVMPELIREFHDKIPMLGICLGHQALGEFFGARLLKAEKPMHGKISLLKTNDDLIFEGHPESFKVVRYHSLILEQIPEDVKVIAQTIEGEVMAIKHKQFPVYGIQYHPEAHLTEYGLKTLHNWAAIHQLIHG